jgi:hypothetical protein
LVPQQVNYGIWCPNPRLGSDAPSLKVLMKKPASDLPDDQPIATLKKATSYFSKENFKKDQSQFFKIA